MKNEERIVELLTEMVQKQDQHAGILQQHSDLLKQHSGLLTEQSSLLAKHSEILVDLLVENRETRRQMEHLTSRLGEALDTFYRVVDRNAEYDQRFKEFEIRLIRLEDKPGA